MNLFNKNKTKKILVIRYGTIGDTIFVLPFLKELRNNNKDAIIDVVNNNGIKFILEQSGYVNSVFDYKIFKSQNVLKLIMTLKKYDVVYFLSKATTLSNLCLLAGVKKRIGLNFKDNNFLTHSVNYDAQTKHVIDLYLDLLKQDGISSSNNILENIFVNLEEYKYAPDGKFVTIQAYSRADLKNWDDNKWLEVIKFITHELNYSVALLGGKDDYEKYDKYTKDLENVYNYCGKTSVKESTQLIRQAQLHIGIDSGLIHIAASMKKKSILLHGSTSLLHWKPQNINCKIISKNYSCCPCCFVINVEDVPCKYNKKCLNDITSQDVINEIKNILNN